MLSDRIVGALTFRKGVYAEVEQDTGFTHTAWVLVVVISFLGQLGAQASGNIGQWLVGTVTGTAFAVIGFAMSAFVVAWVGRAAFRADVNFGEMVRTLGLAYVWTAIGIIGILAAMSGALATLLGPVTFVAAIAGLVAWCFAAKEALDRIQPMNR